MNKLKGKLLVLKISLLFMSFPFVYLYKKIQYRLFPMKIEKELRENIHRLEDLFKPKSVMIALNDIDRTEIDISSMRSMEAKCNRDKMMWELTLRTEEDIKLYYTTKFAMDLDYNCILEGSR